VFIADGPPNHPKHIKDFSSEAPTFGASSIRHGDEVRGKDQMRSGHLNNTPLKMHIRECSGARPPPEEIKKYHLAERSRLALTPSSLKKATGKVTL
jgi:hypothetical protein